MTYSTYHLPNDHTLTLVAVAPLGDGDRALYRVDERNSLGTFIRFAYSTYRQADAEAWIQRQLDRAWRGWS